MATETWKYLPKDKKDTLVFMKPDDMQMLLDKKQYGMFYDLHRTLVQIAHDKSRTLSEGMKECLIHPYVLYGAEAHSRLEQHRRAGDQFISARGLVNKRRKAALEEISGVEAAELIKQNDWTTLNEIVLTLHTLQTMEELSEGQQEFLELAEQFT